MPAQPPRSEARTPQRARQRITLRTSTNRFDIDMSRVPPGMTVEWKRRTIAAQEDRENLINAEANGWTPVPADRHPEMAGRRAVAGQEIVRGGLVLMERPAELTAESRELEREEAEGQVINQIRRLRMDPKTSGAGKGLKRQYEPIPADDVSDAALSGVRG